VTDAGVMNTGTRGTMADYTLKNFKHGRIDGDSILVLN